MRLLPFACFATLAACCASAAWGQNGLIGSPELLRVPQQNAVQDPQIPASYPSTGVPAVQPTPTPTYQPAPTPTYQPTPTPTYQPAPTPTYQQAPVQSYQPAPVQSYQPAPVQSYQPAPVQSYQPAQTPIYQPAPIQTQDYYPQQQTNTSYPQTQPNYRYPAQTPTTAMNQPYPSGAKNKYPAPYLRPSMQTAYAEQPPQVPPMPTPPGNPASPRMAPAGSTMLGDPQAQQTPGVMNQMLAEQNGCVDNGCGPNGPYCGSEGRGFGRPGPCGEGTSLDGCGQGAYCNWYSSVSALVMGRSDGRRFWTSYQDGNLSNQLTNTQFGLQWKWGGEVTLGRRFCCECVPYAVEASFWTTEQFSGYRDTSLAPGGLVSTPLIVSYLDFNGISGTAWFDGALAHHLERQDEFQNLEVNLIREQLACAKDSPWDVGWMAGVRYFRFREMLTFSSISQTGAGDAYLQDNITNNLIGAQVGFDAAYNLKGGLRLFITPKVGVYDNILDSTFQARARTSSSTAYIDGSSSEGTFPAHGSKVGLSFLTQVDLGADWQFSKNWSARAGYRVVALTGMGLADDQFPQYINDIPEIQNVQHVSSLVLHGAFFGVTCNY